MNEIPTPRTDAAEQFCYGHIDRKWVSPHFARSLERELAVAEEALKRIYDGPVYSSGPMKCRADNALRRLAEMRKTHQ